MPKKDSKTKDIQTVEQVQEIPLSQIHPFEGHPFKVVDDDELMQQTIDSITQFGVLNPVIIRPDENGYEKVSDSIPYAEKAKDRKVICPNCGNAVKDAAFCSECGAKLGEN